MDSLARDIGQPPTSGFLPKLRRYWWIVATVGLLGLVGSYVVTGLQPKTFEASTSVLVTPTNATATAVAGGRAADDVNMDTEIQLVKSMQVAVAAKALLKTDQTPQRLVGRVTVSIPPNTRVLEIVFRDPTAEGARAGSHAFAQAYLNVRADAAKKDIAAQVAALTTQIAGLAKTLEEQSSLATSLAPDSPARAYADAQVDIIKNQIVSVNSRLAPLQTAAVTPGEVIVDAEKPGRPSRPILALNLASGLMLGLLAGFGLVSLAARRRGIGRGVDVEETIGRPVLAELSRRVTELRVLPPRAGGETFDRLRLMLVAMYPDGPSSVLLTGATRGRAAGLVAANLAAAHVRAGHEVVLVCADPESLAGAVVGVSTGPGLSDVLRGSMKLASVIQASELPRLSVITTGRELAGAFERISTDRLTAIIGELLKGSAKVIIDAPPTSFGVEAQELARRVDATLVVVERRVADGEAVQGAFRDLESLGARVPGAVVVDDVSRASVPHHSLSATLDHSVPPRRDTSDVG